MINRHYKTGEKLDVAGLNEIIVLLDRSETELTEVGLNCWKPGIKSPPHKHNDKDQIFYIISGAGFVKLGEKTFSVKEGNLCYVSAGTPHQSIALGSEPLCYILFNVFNDPSKEGHATFKDHIEKVKYIRKKQAETGKIEMDGERLPEKIKTSKFFNTLDDGMVVNFGSNITTLLLNRNDTNRLELTHVRWPEGSRETMTSYKDKELTFFILKGIGKVSIEKEEETNEITPGGVVFIPRNTPHSIEVVKEELVYLCLNSLVNQGGEDFFIDKNQHEQ